MQRQSLESGRRSNERGRESWRKRGEGRTGHKSCKCHDCYCNKTTHIPLSQYFLPHSTIVNMTTKCVLFHAQQSYAFSNVYFLSTPTAGNNLIPISVLVYSPQGRSQDLREGGAHEKCLPRPFTIYIQARVFSNLLFFRIHACAHGNMFFRAFPPPTSRVRMRVYG